MTTYFFIGSTYAFLVFFIFFLLKLEEWRGIRTVYTMKEHVLLRIKGLLKSLSIGFITIFVWPIIFVVITYYFMHNPTPASEDLEDGELL